MSTTAARPFACTRQATDAPCELRQSSGPAVCAALTAVSKLIGPDLVNAVLPAVVGLVSHPKELVRKKAVLALHRFQQLDPDRDGALAGSDLDKHFRQALCDKARARVGAPSSGLASAAYVGGLLLHSDAAYLVSSLSAGVELIFCLEHLLYDSTRCAAGPVRDERRAVRAARGGGAQPAAVQEPHPQLRQHPQAGAPCRRLLSWPMLYSMSSGHASVVLRLMASWPPVCRLCVSCATYIKESLQAMVGASMCDSSCVARSQ